MKSKLFKSINCAIALFCAGNMFLNHVDVNVINSSKAVSFCGGNKYEYSSTDNSFSVHKNGELVGRMPTNKKVIFNRSNRPFLQCNATVIAGKMVVAGLAALKVGGDFAAAATAAGMNAIGALGGGAAAGAAAAAEVPGSAAVAATVAGAGEAAAAAAATGASALTLTGIIVPILVGALIGLGLT